MFAQQWKMSSIQTRICSLITETCMRLHNKAISEKNPLQQGGAIAVQHIAVNYNGAAPQSARELRQQIAARF